MQSISVSGEFTVRAGEVVLGPDKPRATKSPVTTMSDSLNLAPKHYRNLLLRAAMKLTFALLTAVTIMLMYLIWPTPWRHCTMTGINKPLRQHRFTHRVEVYDGSEGRWRRPDNRDLTGPLTNAFVNWE